MIEAVYLTFSYTQLRGATTTILELNAGKISKFDNNCPCELPSPPKSLLKPVFEATRLQEIENNYNIELGGRGCIFNQIFFAKISILRLKYISRSLTYA